MIRILINDKPIQVDEGMTILEASREHKFAPKQYDIYIPTLQYLKGIQEEDHSGLCVVEVAGVDGLVNASTTKVADGMKIYTLTPTVLEAQKAALSKILDSHDLDCKSCHRTGNCELQKVQWRLRTTKDTANAKVKTLPVDESGIIVRDENKCIRCGRCIAACLNGQSIGAIEMQDGRVVPANGAKTLSETKCVNCGQCIAVCPVGALRERNDIDRVFEALNDPEKFVVIQAAPSVRAGIGEYYGYPVGSETEGKLAAALRQLGFDRVFDTVFGADLTVMEEAAEFIGRVKNGGALPMMTSCCPGWVKFCEQEYPELLPNVSSCKSPQQMFGAAVKSYFAEKEGIAKENIVVVSAMPCTAKKFELAREDECGAGVPDVDYSITVRELGRMLDRANVEFKALADEKFDSPLGKGTGAGTIFGATGGVMEAALRTAADWMTGESLDKVNYEAVRGVKDVKEASVTVGGRELKVAAVSGLANARALMEKVQSGEAKYDFIEVMACPGGCVNGGGQYQQVSETRTIVDIRAERAATLYALDSKSSVRKAHDNPEIKELYSAYLGEPGSEKAHALLHTHYAKR